MDTKKKTIYYDGTCQFCTVVAKKIENRDTSIRLKDASKDPLPRSLNRTNTLKEIHMVEESSGKVYKNVDVFLKYLEQYKLGKILSFIGSIPGFHHLLQLLYSVTAKNRHNILGTNSRIFWAKTICSLAFFVGVITCYKNWTGASDFPRTPFVNALDRLPLINWGTFSILLILLIGVAFSIHWRRYVVFVAVFVSILAIASQSTFQPWVYEYTVLLLLFALISFGENKNKSTIALAQLIIGATYIASGSYKMNSDYFHSVFPWFIGPVPFSWLLGKDAMSMLAFFSVFAEVFMGFALLWNKSRKIGVIAVTGMHIFILFALGPLGNNWNSAVWPWNMALIALIWVLFWNYNEPILKKLPSQKLATAIVVTLFFVMPILGQYGFWDTHTSFALYSGRESSGHVYTKRPELLPRGLIEKNGEISSWAFSTINVPVTPEPRVLKTVFRKLCKMDPQITMEITHRANKRDKTKKHELITCDTI